MSLRYTEHDLDANKEKKFRKHISGCKSCREKFKILTANYDPELNVDTYPDNIIAETMPMISRERSLNNDRRDKYVKMDRRILAVAVVFVILGTVVFADDIYKGLKELINLMRPTTEWKSHARRAAGGDLGGVLESGSSKELKMTQEEIEDTYLLGNRK